MGDAETRKTAWRFTAALYRERIHLYVTFPLSIAAAYILTSSGLIGLEGAANVGIAIACSVDHAVRPPELSVWQRLRRGVPLLTLLILAGVLGSQLGRWLAA